MSLEKHYTTIHFFVSNDVLWQYWRVCFLYTCTSRFVFLLCVSTFINLKPHPMKKGIPRFVVTKLLERIQRDGSPKSKKKGLLTVRSSPGSVKSRRRLSDCSREVHVFVTVLVTSLRRVTM